MKLLELFWEPLDIGSLLGGVFDSIWQLMLPIFRWEKLSIPQQLLITIAGNMKNTLRIFTISPVVLLGMLTSLSMPVRAEGVGGSTAEAPSLPAVPGVPSVNDLAPGGDGEATEMSDETSTATETPTEEAPTEAAEAPTEEPAAETPTETPAAETPAEAPAAETPTETPAAETPTETPAAETPAESPATESAAEEAPSSDPTASSQTIVDVASSSESFSTLVAAIEAAGLKESLMADGTFTVFAPTNAAFEALPPGVLDKLLMPENKEVLAKVLTHHVLSDKRMAADLSTEEVQSMADSALQIKVDDAGVGIDNAKVLQADVNASNGVIHVIDQVLIPQELLNQPGSESPENQ